MKYFQTINNIKCIKDTKNQTHFMVLGRSLPPMDEEVNRDQWYEVILKTDEKGLNKILNRVREDSIIDIEGICTLDGPTIIVDLPEPFEIETWWGDEF